MYINFFDKKKELGHYVNVSVQAQLN
jgi:hypothetical protein